jgi:hypothetical protein
MLQQTHGVAQPPERQSQEEMQQGKGWGGGAASQKQESISKGGRKELGR